MLVLEVLDRRLETPASANAASIRVRIAAPWTTWSSSLVRRGGRERRRTRAHIVAAFDDRVDVALAERGVRWRASSRADHRDLHAGSVAERAA